MNNVIVENLNRSTRKRETYGLRNASGGGRVQNCMKATGLRIAFRCGMSAVLCAVCLVISSTTALAADPESPPTPPATQARSEEQQFAGAADARTRAELALRDLRKLLQANRATADSETPALPRPTALELLQKGLDAEERKSAADQNKARIDDLRHRTQILSGVWDKYAASVRESTAKLNEAASQSVSLSAAMHQVNGMESYWKQLHMELSSVEQAYSTLCERASRTARQIRESIDAERLAHGEWDQQSNLQGQGVEKPQG